MPPGLPGIIDHNVSSFVSFGVDPHMVFPTNETRSETHFPLLWQTPTGANTDTSHSQYVYSTNTGNLHPVSSTQYNTFISPSTIVQKVDGTVLAYYNNWLHSAAAAPINSQLHQQQQQ